MITKNTNINKNSNFEFVFAIPPVRWFKRVNNKIILLIYGYSKKLTFLSNIYILSRMRGTKSNNNDRHRN